MLIFKLFVTVNLIEDYTGGAVLATVSVQGVTLLGVVQVAAGDALQVSIFRTSLVGGLAHPFAVNLNSLILQTHYDTAAGELSHGGEALDLVDVEGGHHASSDRCACDRWCHSSVSHVSVAEAEAVAVMVVTVVGVVLGSLRHLVVGLADDVAVGSSGAGRALDGVGLLREGDDHISGVGSSIEHVDGRL